MFCPECGQLSMDKSTIYARSGNFGTSPLNLLNLLGNIIDRPEGVIGRDSHKCNAGKTLSLQQCNSCASFPGTVFTHFRDVYIETLDFSPEGTGMDAHLGGRGLSIPAVFSQDLIDITFFNLLPGEGLPLRRP